MTTMDMAKATKIAVVGATGAVGQQLLNILQERRFAMSDLIPFASARSEGKELYVNGKTYRCQTLKPGCFEGVGIAFFDASDAVSHEWVPEAAKAGAWVVDNSGAFRMESDVPLLVPEVNGSELDLRLKRPGELTWRERIIAGPNCSTVQMVLALKPIRDRWGLKRVVVSTYQSTSGAGAAAMTELTQQTQDYLDQKASEPKVFPHHIAFNCIPQIGGFKSDGYTSEEQKIMEETRKILSLPALRINATAVRVPTYSCHGESVNVECERPFELREVRSALSTQSGIVVQDDLEKKYYPMGIEGSGKDPVFVGRLRKDLSVDHGLSFWVISDNLRKGAALNAVQIGEQILKSMS